MVASAAGASIQTGQAASANRQQPSTSTGPQVRSRVTVVCAECKRLKLRCDRLNPCGSCLKRDTVLKCQYTPAATEKVDTHSLNNRLTHVESFLALHTCGRFQSSYPSSGLTGDSTNAIPCASSSDIFHHHTSPFHRNDVENFFLITPQSLTSVWLKDLEISTSKFASFGKSCDTPMKVESTSFDYERRHPDAHVSSSSCDGAPQTIPRSQLKPRLKSQRNAAHIALPPMTIYFLSGPSNTITQRASISDSAVPLQSELLSRNNKPQATPALLSSLPSLPTCQRLLRFAGEVFRIRPLWFDPSYGPDHGWKGFEIKCLQALGGGEDGTGKRKEKSLSAKRAKEIYFGGQQHLGADAESGSGGVDIEGPVSLTFFAQICAVLAIGAKSSEIAGGENTPTTESPAFFYALSQQALGVWDTYNSSSPTTTTTGDIEEELEYLFASLLGVVYFLLSGTVASAADSSQNNVEESGEDEDSRLVSTLVSKMVNVARAMHLDRERACKEKKKSTGNRRSNNSGDVSEVVGSESVSLGRSQKFKDIEKGRTREEWKRTIWLEVMFYDLFVADVLGRQSQLSMALYRTNVPASAEILRSKALDSDETMKINRLEMQNVLPKSPPSQSPPSGVSSTGGVVIDDAYLDARFRLAQLAQAIKRRNSLPDCCSYTLDQAAALESEIRSWLQELPPALQIPLDDDLTQTTPHMANETKTKGLHGFELAIIGNFLIMNVYMPFLDRAGRDSCNSVPQNFPATSSCTLAAQAIIHLSKELQSFLTSAGTVVPTLPMMFDFYPLDKLVFTAVVACAHAAFARKNLSFSFNAATMAQDVAVGLDVLSFLSTSVTGPRFPCSEMKKVMDMLQDRLSHRKSVTKRKHDHIDLPPFRAPSPSDTDTLATEVDAESRLIQLDHFHHTGLITQQGSNVTDGTMSSTLSTRDSVHPSPQSISTSTTTATCTERRQKDKKTAKKQGYPARSVRIRQGKLPNRLQSDISAPSGIVTPKSRSQSIAHDVLNFARKSQQKAEQPPSYPDRTQNVPSEVMSPVELEFGVDHRSRSSSINHAQSGACLIFEPSKSQSRDKFEIPPKKRQNLHDIREQIQYRNRQEQQLSSQSPPFAQHVFDEGQRQHLAYNQIVQPGPFDGAHSSGPPMDGMTYGVTTLSPFSNASSFGSVASPKLDSTPQIFSPHPPAPLRPGDQSIPYFPSQSSAYRPPIFTASPVSSGMGTQHPHLSLTSASGMEPGMASVPGSPVYDKSSYHRVENYPEHHQALRQHQLQDQPMDSGFYSTPNMSTQGQQIAPGVPVSPWLASQSQTYWENGSEFKFYP